MSQTQDFTVVHGIKVRVRFDGKPSIITLVLGGKDVSYKYRNGWAEFVAEPLEIHSVYRVEI